MKIDLRKKFIIVIHGILLILISLIMVFYPIYISKFIDNISNIYRLKNIFLVIVLLMIAKGIFNIFDMLLENYLNYSLEYDLKKTLMSKLLDSSYLNIIREDEGKLINLNEDVDSLIDFYINFLSIIFKNILILSGIFIVSVNKLSYFSSLFIVMIIVFLILINKIKKKSKSKVKNTKAAYDRMISLFSETFTLLEEFIYIDKDTYLINRLRKSILKFFNYEVISNFISYEYWISSIFVFSSMKIIVMISGIFLIENGLVTLGSLYLFIYYIDLIEDPIMEIRLQLETLPNIGVVKERIFDFLDLNSRKLEYGNYVLSEKVSKIEFTNVSFAYSENEIFKDFNYTFRKKKYLIRGASGSGKSTLINLMVRLFDPIDGSIKYNDMDIRMLKKGYISEKIEYIDQKIELSNEAIIADVISENQESKKILNSFLPNKDFATPLDELSNGEYRSLYLLKALNSNKDIIIMDETFLGIDEGKCDTFFKLVDNMDKIIVIISHEERIIAKVDEVIDFGKI
ncbi:ABC transporter ATP-binding protein [Anaerococcus sp. AGMB00486]|uniref:ABC transporter ATP-binding protein n=1 Tax=Anaerococcus faecalis TaxID=2742993 RepID=A0ABX2N7V6_9FIRM|nr:ABC transporter ATP-binding protein [Anaerococcus faecalis]NVF10777.1 ABC transporter ATP-binding protein [Anaerococcus faecalis]